MWRGYTWGFVIGWWDAHWIQTGRYSIIQEVPFGGYRLHIRWKESFWNWNSNRYTHDYPLEDFYATAPGSSTPINAGTVLRDFKLDVRYFNQEIILANSPADGHYHFQAFPPPPSGFWANSFGPTPGNVFSIYAP